MDWLNPGRWLLAGGLILALVLGYNAWAVHQQDIGEARANARWQQATDELKEQARTTLATETAKAKTATDALRQFKDTQELKDANSRQTIANLRNEVRAGTRAGGGPGLRDPWAPGCGSGGSGTQTADPTGANPGDPDRADAGRVVSPELEGLLLDRLAKADVINIAYASCREDARQLRLQLSPGN